jgi:anti-anti-sigma regulatory factor
MGMNVNIPVGAARIAMPKKFDFTMYHGFIKSCTTLLENSAVREIEVELSAVEHLDTFALDMLILLKERATAANKSISLINISTRVLQKLELTHLGINIGRASVTQPDDSVESSCNPVYGKYAGLRQDLSASY